MIRIFRLKTGQDIIGNVLTEQNQQENLTINEPMAVSFDTRGKEIGLIMSHWLPVQLIEKNQVVLNMKDILAIIEPNGEFTEYYENTVDRLTRLMKVKKEVDEMSDEQISEIMEDMFDGKDKTYH